MRTIFKTRGRTFYAPTSTATDDIINNFYSQLQDVINSNKKNCETLVVAGDFNAKLGNQRIPLVMGPHGYDDRNSRGDRLVDFCMVNNLTAAHSWFPKRSSYKVTWISRRKRKDVGTPEFTALRNEVKHPCQKDLNEWLVTNINTLNQAYQNHNCRAMFKTADVLLQKTCTPVVNIKDANGLLLETAEEEIQRWHQYAVDLFESNRPRPPHHTTEVERNPPSPEETKEAIQALKNHKAPGVDCVKSEALKAATQDPEIFKTLHGAVCNIWNSGKWPQSMTKSVYIKNSKRGLCNNYRTLALISQASKIVLNVIQRRLERTANIEVSDTQCGFVSGKGTTDGIYLLKGVAESHYAGKRPLRLVFVDYKKAFDSVNQALLFAKLRYLGVEEDVMRLLEDLYINSNGKLRWKGRMTDEFETPVGVR
ncbi:uncharacterized protein LOC119733828 [Patiria miniata]|uniref:Reverse transcriptase domain-containing protein n=1 Tax=Patiria miniata TaxID=46514 RepID=A0A914AHW2_PATMI|nr:uncharacterized protein LOC119733828 [Patiria miniata]